MVTALAGRLQSFGARSLLTHTIMAFGLVGAVLSGFVVGGELGQFSFVALMNFTAGVWICQSIHAIGNPEYDGILSVVRGDDDW